MIDIENEIIEVMKSFVASVSPEAKIISEYASVVSSFPCVTISEDDNSDYLRSRTTSTNGNHSVLMYTINVYSNSTRGKKTEARKIMGAVCDAFDKLGFTRTMMKPVPNVVDATIYRITARFTAIADNNKVIYKS